ncbi:Hypothetical predicted protein [Cloeon dipterum]|uniref:Chitin-binding type-2 domain-containing protein n=1 Tax=Cloeon dipterum TaxID=197152 RepID=A0A8S1DDP0_9INSE|nr:Hypothetical predicted protein [Cloeon dipterum]
MVKVALPFTLLLVCNLVLKSASQRTHGYQVCPPGKVFDNANSKCISSSTVDAATFNTSNGQTTLQISNAPLRKCQKDEIFHPRLKRCTKVVGG